MPPELLEDAKAALVKTQEMAQKSFGLELRVATLPVAKIRAAAWKAWSAAGRTFRAGTAKPSA